MSKLQEEIQSLQKEMRELREEVERLKARQHQEVHQHFHSHYQHDPANPSNWFPGVYGMVNHSSSLSSCSRSEAIPASRTAYGMATMGDNLSFEGLS